MLTNWANKTILTLTLNGGMMIFDSLLHRHQNISKLNNALQAGICKRQVFSFLLKKNLVFLFQPKEFIIIGLDSARMSFGTKLVSSRG